jgi:pimeloyl-ACP methyl ester carboxylesterase
MTGKQAVRAMYLRSGSDATFAMLHQPVADARPGSSVVMVGPWGWDEIASYRSRRTWAERLADRGHAVLRIDLPGSGDSSGMPDDAGLVPSWIESVASAARWLAEARPAHVAVLGLGLGGLVAAQAAADGAPVDELMLWGAQPQGRSVLREQRAFAKLQGSRYGTIDGAGGELPADWLEVGGFVESAETMAAIERLDVREMELGRVSRVLLLGRDGRAADAALRQRLVDSGLDVTVEPGNGWEAMCFHPERYQPPLDVFARVDAWLAASQEPGDASVGPGHARVEPPKVRDRADQSAGGNNVTASDHAILTIDATSIRESAFGPEDGSATFFGIRSEPVTSSASDLIAVYLNAGAIRRIGPNRMWVEGARRWAARGVASVRVDVEAIGDAAGDAGMYEDVGRFYTPERAKQVGALLDEIERQGLGRRFVLIGLCAGAYSAFQSAAADPRVVAALSVNARILVWDRGIMARRDAQLVNRVLRADSWRRILSGQTTPRTVLAIGRSAVAEASRPLVERIARRVRGHRPDPRAWPRRLERVLDAARDHDARVVLAFAGDEPVTDELVEEGLQARMADWPNVVFADLPGDDHTLRPIAAQLAFHRLLDDELESPTATTESAR